MRRFWADLGLFYCAAIWGATFYLVKGALGAVHPVTMVAYRFLLCAVLLLPWALPRLGARGRQARELLGPGLLLSALLTILYVTQTVGLGYTSAANSGFITGLFVLFVPVFLFLKSRRVPAHHERLAVATALCGLWLLTGGPGRFNRGDALTLLAAVAYAAHLLAIDRCVKRDADPVLLAFHQFWMTGLAGLLLAMAGGCPLSVGGRSAWGVIVFLAVFPTLSGFFIQMLAQKTVEPVKVSLIFSLEPVFAAVFAWTLGGEAFRPLGAFGGALILAAMLLNELPKLCALAGMEA